MCVIARDARYFPSVLFAFRGSLWLENTHCVIITFFKIKCKNQLFRFISNTCVSLIFMLNLRKLDCSLLEFFSNCLSLAKVYIYGCTSYINVIPSFRNIVSSDQ